MTSSLKAIRTQTTMSSEPSADLKLGGAVTAVDRAKDVEAEPTDEELITLEHVSDRIPFSAWLIIFCELCEGFAYFGTFLILQNYIQFPVRVSGSKQPGALDRGQRVATAITVSYNLLCYLTPMGAAIVADQFWGRYKTMMVSCLIYLVGLIVLLLTSIPVSIKTGIALPGLICGLMMLGVGVGGVRSTAGPFMVEQYVRAKPVVKG